MPADDLGWEVSEFLRAVGIIVLSAMFMYALAKTLLIDPLERQRRQFAFYTGEEATRRDRIAYRNAPAEEAAAAGAQLLAVALQSPRAAAGRSAEEAIDDDDSGGEDDDGNEVEPEGSGQEEHGDDRESFLRTIQTQKRQIATLEAVNDQLCADYEELETKVENIRELVA